MLSPVPENIFGGHGQEGRLHTFDIKEWMMARNLVRADDMRFIVGELRNAEYLPEPVDLGIAAEATAATGSLHFP